MTVSAALHPPSESESAPLLTTPHTLDFLDVASIDIGAETDAFRERLDDPAFRQAVAQFVIDWLAPTVESGELAVIVIKARFEGSGATITPPKSAA